MQTKNRKRRLSFMLCMVLIVAMALFTTGCSGNEGDKKPVATEKETNVQTEENASGTEKETNVQTEENASGTEKEITAQTEENASGTENETAAQAGSNVLGEGNTTFTFTVVDKEGEQTQFEIHTDKETVGEALKEIGMIDGDESEYGLYVKVVNGITADYDKDGVYWAFYINDEYAQTGVDATKITEGERYSFKIE